MTVEARELYSSSMGRMVSGSRTPFRANAHRARAKRQLADRYPEYWKCNSSARRLRQTREHRRSWARLSYLALDLVGKRIELLKEWLPQVRHVAVLARPQHPGEHRERQATQEISTSSTCGFLIFPRPISLKWTRLSAPSYRPAATHWLFFPTQQCSQ
jgi:hypothetical protein